MKNKPDFQITPNLAASEIRCKDGCQLGMEPGDFDPEAARRFELLRAANGGTPIRINSGLRCHAHHKAIYRRMGRRPIMGSRHLTGRALDLASRDPEALAKVALQIADLAEGGIGFYSWGIHIDTGRRARWGETAEHKARLLTLEKSLGEDSDSHKPKKKAAKKTARKAPK